MGKPIEERERLIMEREGLKTKAQLRSFLISLYEMEDRHALRLLTRLLLQRWRSGVTRGLYLEMEVLYACLSQLMWRVRR
jgi:hypothetical protein